MGIGSWFSARDRSRIARSIGIRPCRRRRRDGRRSEATPVETLEQRLYLSAAPIDSGHDEDGADHAHSFWYIPPDFTGPLPDEEHAEDQPNHFVASGYKWPQSGGLGTPVTVTYSYSNLLDGGLKGGLTAAQLRSAVEKALGLWASVAPLHFVEVVDSGPIVSDNSYSAGTYPKIRIGHEYIDGGSGANILAHAYFPTGSGLAGDLHLDNSNTWKLGPSGGIDVIEVLTHELGHALGLDHEPTPSGSVGNNAIMNPYYGARYTTGLNSAHLLQDDINGIRTIYGTGVGSVIPLANSGSGGADDHGNSATGASTITIGTSVAGNLEVTSDQDWFKFQATAGITYTFQTALGSLSDSVIRLYNTNGATLLRTNDNAAGIGLASKIEWTASLSGTYFLSVVGAQISQTGTYTLATSARNMPPILASIGSKSMSYTQDTLSISLSASDLNGDPLTYSARVVTNVSPLAQTAYQLDQQNGFYVTSDFPLNDYYKNARGAGEKYLRGSNNAWYLIFANGELYRWHTSLADLELIQILDSSYYNDPSLLWNAQPVNTPNITATVNGSTLTINPPPGYLGTFEVEVTVSDGSLFDFETISVTTVNLPATLAPVQNQTMSHTSDTIQVTLLGADPDGDVLTYSAEVVGSAANHQIDQSRGLYVTADFLTTNYYFNARGAGEKYLMGDNGSWYLLYSDGKLFQWGTSLADCSLVAELDPACFQNPSLVWNTQPLSVVNDVVTTITQNQLTINPPSGFAGAFQVRVRVSDGTNVATQVFTVDVANIPPVLAPIGNRTMSRSQNTIEIDLAATDADADLITYDVTISGGNEAYQLDQTYGFFVTSDFLGTDYYVNARGVGEKYLMGNNGTWFLLYADGKLYQWGGSLAASTLIAELDPSFYQNPELLWNPQPGAADSVEATIVGQKLIVNPPTGYAGTFQVTVTASDGASSDSETFSIQVANLAPAFAPINNRTMPTSQNQINVGLTATDPDGDPITFSVSLEEGNPAWTLDQTYGFHVTPDFIERDYYRNSRGANEKYLMGNNGTWFLVREGGAIYLWNTTVANSTLIATLGDEYYNDPGLLANAQPLGTDIAQVSISGTTLTVNPFAGYTGTFAVTVTASDGQATTSRSFTVTVTANLTAESELPAANALYINFDGANLSREELSRWAGNDWSDILDAQLDPEQDGITVQSFWADWSEREVFFDRVLSIARDQLATFHIDVIRHDGDAVEGIGATTVFVGDVDIPGSYWNWLGVASDIDSGNDNATDIGFVLPFYLDDDFESSARAIANLILHEAGHTWGLEHVETDGEPDLMGFGHDGFTPSDLASVDAAFLDRDFAVHEPHGEPRTQNSRRTLSTLFA